SYHPGRFISQTTTKVSAGPSARAVAGPGKTRSVGRLRPRICCGSPAGSAYDLQDFYSSQAYDFGALQRFSPCCNPAHPAGGSRAESSIAIIGEFTPDTNALLTFAKTYGLAMTLTQEPISPPPCCDSEITTDIETATAMANSFGR